jgi:LacI family transcriptional regulator
VARVAGTSVAVVSYVVNNGPRPVAPATRQRVLDAIRVTGYRPNPVARALVSGSSGGIGVVVPDIANPFFAELARAIEGAAAASGRLVLLGNSGYDPVREGQLLDAYADQRVAGIILVPTLDSVDLNRFRESDVQLVLLDRGPLGEWPAVSSDHRGGARLATQHLIEHGYREIAAVTGPEELSSAQLRLAGWHDALESANLDAGPVVYAQLTREAGYLAGRQLLESAARPRAVFVANDAQAFGFLRAATELHIRIPDDLAVIGFDGTSWAGYVTPPLSTVEQPVTGLAEEVMKVLDTNSRPATPVELACSLVIRDSCGHHPGF